MVFAIYWNMIATSDNVVARDVSHSKDDASILKFLIEAENKGVSSKSNSTICVIFSHMDSKPDTVEKLLQRIHESPVGEQVIAAILASSRNLQPAGPITDAHSGGDSTVHSPTTRDTSVAYTITNPDDQQVEYNRNNGDSGSSLVSPLHILADAVETERLASLHIVDSSPTHHEERSLDDTSNAWLSRISTQRLIKYFSMLASSPPTTRILIARSYQSLVLCHRKTGKFWLHSLSTLR
jgi:hypothetical protein